MKDTPELQEIMNKIIRKCFYPVSKKFSNCKRREREGEDGAMGRSLGLCFSPPYKQKDIKDIAAVMVQFIDLTYDTITNILKDANLYKFPATDNENLSAVKKRI